MEKSISNHNYDIFKHFAIAALIFGILILCLAPSHSAGSANAKDADKADVTYEAVILTAKVVDSSANKQAQEVETPTETASEINQAQP